MWLLLLLLENSEAEPSSAFSLNWLRSSSDWVLLSWLFLSDDVETESDCCWALDCAAGMLDDEREENKFTLKIFSKSSFPGDF